MIVFFNAGRYFGFFAFLALIISLSGCDNSIAANVAKETDYYENNAAMKIYFCPKDDCENAIVNFVNHADKSVHCAFYDLELENLIKAVSKKSREADVKVIIDNGNYEGEIRGEGVKTVASKQYMHNKFCVFDDGIVLTGSMNPTNNDAYRNNNNLLIINSKYISKNYNDEFDELWEGILSSGDNVEYAKINSNIGIIENYFCPEDCTLERGGGIYRAMELVKNAKQSVKVAAFSFTHEGLADELVKAAMRGINVSIVIEAKQRNVVGSQYERLKGFGLNIRVDGNKYNMHHKFIVIDNESVITGSPNFTFSGNNRNDENAVVIFNNDLALKFGLEFNSIFDSGVVI